MNNFWLLYRKRRELIRRLDWLLNEHTDLPAINQAKKEIAKIAKEIGKWLHGQNPHP